MAAGGGGVTAQPDNKTTTANATECQRIVRVLFFFT